MKIQNWLKQEWIYLLLLLLPFVLVAYFWNDIPARFPIHFNLNGNADKWSDNPAVLIWLSAINLPLYFFLYFLPQLDKNKKNVNFYQQYLTLVRFLAHLFLAFVPVLILLSAVKGNIDVVWFIKIGTVVFIMLLSNFLNNTQRNYLIGFRTPWALLNDTVWRKTQNFSARLWFGTSVLMLIILLAGKDENSFFLIYISIISVIPFIYSFLIYRKITTEI